MGVSAHSAHEVQYKAKWWHRWRDTGHTFRWREDAQSYINSLD